MFAEVRGSGVYDLRIVLQEGYRDVALIAEKPAHLASRVIVIRIKMLYKD